MRNAIASRRDTAFIAGLAALPVVGTCSLAWNQFGSILAQHWLPYSMATALLVVGLLWSGRVQCPPRPAVLGIAGLLGLGLWDAISLTWSAEPALARDEALLVAFYAVVFAVPLLVLRTEADRRAATAIVVALLVALAFSAFVYLLIVERPGDDYEHGRLTFPISYVNAQAALFLIGFWPSIALASRRATRPLLRSAAIAGATALLAGWLSTQSKGGLVALAAAGIVFFAVNRERLRAVVPAIIPAALVGAAYEPLTRPFRERNDADFAVAIRSASWTALALVGIAAAVGLAYATADRRITVSRRARRAAQTALVTGLAVTVVGSAALFFVSVDRPGHYLAERWHSFKRLPAHEQGSSHLTSLGSNRYDFWRTELHDIGHHPVAGIGARGFAASYLQQRRSNETPARGHSLVLDTLSETGLVGFALLVAGIGVPLVAVARRGRQTVLLAGLAAAGAFGLAHATVDWIWTIPAVGSAFFLLLGIANAGATGDRALPLLKARVAIPLGVIVLVLAVGGFGTRWLSARFTSAALEDQTRAVGRLEWARRLDPLAVEPLLAEATLARSPADLLPLERAVAKEPRRAGLHYLLGRAYLAAGRKVDARRELLEAMRLDPRDDFIRKALRRAG